MTEYNEGDLVEAVKGENLIRGRLTADCCTSEPILRGWGVSRLQADGYTLTRIEKATRPLPTEPGNYADRDGDVWRINGDGKPFLPRHPGASRNPELFAPFTRLEPVPETAKKVIEFIANSYDFGPPSIILPILALARYEFAVSS